MENTIPHRSLSDNDCVPSRLTVFAFLWASQALVHQEFFSHWLFEDNLLGWVLTIFALATLLFPHSIVLFSAMLVSSVLYNVISNWPFVVNHILLETIINLTILGAIVTTLVIERRENVGVDIATREHVFDRFAPVVGAMLVVMYYVILVSKLNWNFIVPETSCVTEMYGRIVKRLEFLPPPTENWVIVTWIWAFLFVELLIPVFLTFRKTRYLAFFIGLPFHLLLGLIDHRTFSAHVFALYGLVCIEPLTMVLGITGQRIKSWLGSGQIKTLIWVFRLIAVLGVTYLIAKDLEWNDRVHSLPIWRLVMSIYFSWSMLLFVGYFTAIIWSYRTGNGAPPRWLSSRPGLLWLMLAVVILNGLSPYLGFKTETSFAMYSSLRTEGGQNNHMFMPALRLADYQDDLVEIIETNHPKLQKTIDKNQVITYFELRRIVSETTADLHVTYQRGGELHQFTGHAGINSDDELARKHPIWLAKLLYFRPIFKGENSYCQH